METLERIVRDNAKQRFTLQAEPTGPDGADELWIRANQGHSVKVVLSPELCYVVHQVIDGGQCVRRRRSRRSS